MKSKLLQGNCLDQMQTLPEDSIDCIVTDPPYFMINKNGSGFMGRKWDSLNIKNAFDILCKSKDVVQSVINLFSYLKIDLNTEEVNTVQKSVNLNREEEKIRKSNASAQFVVRNFGGVQVTSKVSINSVHGIVLTREDLLDTLKELFPYHIAAFQNLPKNALYVIPFSLMEIVIKNIVQLNALELPKLDFGKEIFQMNLKISQLITSKVWGWTISRLEKQCSIEMEINAWFAGMMEKELNFACTTLSPIELQKIIQWITLLQFASNVTPKSKEGLSHALIQQFHENWATEALRVLKPGSFCFSMNAPRSDCMKDMINGFQNAGFNIGFTPIYWTFFTGFPKSMNISRAIDRKFKKEREVIGAVEHPERQNRTDPPPADPFSGITKIIKQSKLIPSVNSIQEDNIDEADDFFDTLLKENDSIAYDSDEYQMFRDIYDGGYDELKDLLSPMISFLEVTKNHDLIPKIKKYFYDAEKLPFDAHKNTKNTRQNPYHAGMNMTNVATGLETAKSIYAQVNLPDKRTNGRNSSLPLTKPACEESEKAVGAYAGFNPKPAVEIIFVFMKPLSEKSYTAQYLSNGKGVSWFSSKTLASFIDYDTIFTLKKELELGEELLSDERKSDLEYLGLTLDQLKSISETDLKKRFSKKIEGCRIPYPEYQEAINANKKGYATQTESGIYGWNNGNGEHTVEFWKTDKGRALKKKLVGGRLDHGYTIASERLEGYKNQDIENVDPNLQGRFPANLLVSDNVLDNGTITKSKSQKMKLPTKGSFAGSEGEYIQDETNPYTVRGGNDCGDQSRYFSLDLWYEAHLSKLPKKQQQTFPFLTVAKPSKSEKNKGLGDFETKQTTDGSIRANPETGRIYGANHTPKKNTHPTVKSLKLMRYLILLGSRPGDIILDPFCGSGTTCVAAKLEDRRFIGVELSPEYFEIMKARVKAVKKQKKLSSFF